jgi:hypothetical protein
VTVSRSYRTGDLVGVKVFGDCGDFPNPATEQTVSLGSLYPHRVETLLRVANVAAFFTHEQPHSGAIGPDVLAVCHGHGSKARLLAFPEPLPDPVITVLISLAHDYLFARRTIAIEKVFQTLRDAVAASRAPPESVAFDHEIEPDVDRYSELGGYGIVCGVSEWFSSPGARYYEDIRSASEIAPAD